MTESNETSEIQNISETSVNSEHIEDSELQYKEMSDTMESMTQQIQSIFADPWNNTCTCSPYIPKPIVAEPGPNVERKKKILQNVYKTETYLKEHCINELIQYLFTKLLSDMPDNPVTYLENVLEECMLFRAGHGSPPVIFQTGHLQAVIKSFDPGQSGWLKPNQIQQIFLTVGLSLNNNIIDEMAVADVLQMIQQRQIEELCALLTAGT